MDASQFALWLQGFAELNTEPPTKEQWQSIREHLQLVFAKVTPEVKTTPVQKPVIDLSKNDELKKMFEKNKERYQPWPPTPMYQPYWLDGVKYPPGTIIC
jgi:hypothetical protein